MFGTLGVTPPPGILPAPVNTLGFDNATHVWTEPLAFRKPFPAHLQPFPTFFEPAGIIRSRFPDGWRGVHWDYHFAVPFPATLQPIEVPFEPRGFIQSTFPDGWRGPQWECRVIPPLPASRQPFTFGSGNPGIPAWF
jgi:hypothetical protein